MICGFEGGSWQTAYSRQFWQRISTQRTVVYAAAKALRMIDRLSLGNSGWYVLLLACGLPLLLYILQGRIEFNIADEGYIWYGIEAIIHQGAVPMLDYRAYDPGRYYWSAAWSVVFGSGIMGFRLSSLVLQMIGLAFGLLAARYVLKRWWMLLCVALILTVWMLPRYKYVESGFAMLNVYVALRLILNPTQSRYFLLGVVVGLTAYFGRNLGLYTALGSCVVLIYVQLKVSRLPLRQALFRAAVWASGVAAGYLPMVLMIVLIPGFADAFRESILFRLRQDNLNIPRPVVWPWQISLTGAALTNTLPRLAVSFVYIVMPVFFVTALIGGFLTRHRNSFENGKALLIASASMGIFYMHQAFGRADLAHLGQSIHPFVLGLTALPFAFQHRYKRPIIVGVGGFLLAITVSCWVLDSPLLRLLHNPDNYRPYPLQGQTLMLQTGQIAYLEAVQDVVDEYMLPDEAILLIPYESGLYPIIEQPSPIYDTYLLWKATKAEQELAVQQLEEKNVQWIIFRERPVDNLEDKHLAVIYDRLWNYIQMNYEPVSMAELPETHVLLRRRD
jgi:hypothetical protein